MAGERNNTQTVLFCLKREFNNLTSRALQSNLNLELGCVRSGEAAQPMESNEAGYSKDFPHAGMSLWVISGHSGPSTVMSALPPKADIHESERHVRYGPIADIN